MPSLVRKAVCFSAIALLVVFAEWRDAKAQGYCPGGSLISASPAQARDQAATLSSAANDALQTARELREEAGRLSVEMDRLSQRAALSIPVHIGDGLCSAIGYTAPCKAWDFGRGTGDAAIAALNRDWQGAFEGALRAASGTSANNTALIQSAYSSAVAAFEASQDRVASAAASTLDAVKAKVDAVEAVSDEFADAPTKNVARSASKALGAVAGALHSATALSQNNKSFSEAAATAKMEKRRLESVAAQIEAKAKVLQQKSDSATRASAYADGTDPGSKCLAPEAPPEIDYDALRQQFSQHADQASASSSSTALASNRSITSLNLNDTLSGARDQAALARGRALMMQAQSMMSAFQSGSGGTGGGALSKVECQQLLDQIAHAKDNRAISAPYAGVSSQHAANVRAMDMAIKSNSDMYSARC